MSAAIFGCDKRVVSTAAGPVLGVRRRAGRNIPPLAPRKTENNEGTGGNDEALFKVASSAAGRISPGISLGLFFCPWWQLLLVRTQHRFLRRDAPSRG